MRYFHCKSELWFDSWADYMLAHKIWAGIERQLRFHGYVSGYRDGRPLSDLLQYRIMLHRNAQKKERIRKEIKQIKKEREVWRAAKRESISFAVRDTNNIIHEQQLAIKKAKFAISIAEKAIRNQMKEASKEFHKKNPFPLERQLRNLQSRLSKIKP